MRRKLRSFFALPLFERLGLARAWFLLLGIDLALRGCSLPQVQHGLDRLSRSPSPSPISPSRWAELVRIAAGRHLLPMRCLQRSLALRFFLRRQGIDAELRIGVQKQEDRLHAHAWVETAGSPIGEAPAIESRFLPLLPRVSGR